MKTYRIKFSNLCLKTRIGLLESEHHQDQRLIINAEFEIELKNEINDQSLSSVLDYRILREIIIKECSFSTLEHINFLETLVDRLSLRFLREFPEILSINLNIGKPDIFPDCALVSVGTYKLRS